MKGKTLAFAGAGAMAEALIRGVLSAGLIEPAAVLACDPREDRLSYLQKQYGINVSTDNRDGASRDMVVLAVKPAVLPSVLEELAPHLAGKVLLSVAAGITTGAIEKVAGNIAVVRVMPNTPALIGSGASAYCLGQYAGEEEDALARVLLGAVGKVAPVPEHLMDAVTGLSGSGPAYVYLVLEALIDAGVRVGLPRDLASTLATQTVLGAAQMVFSTGEHPGRLKDMVTTPGGTTIAGLHILEAGNIRATIMDAVMAATQRSKELSKS